MRRQLLYDKGVPPGTQAKINGSTKNEWTGKRQRKRNRESNMGREEHGSTDTIGYGRCLDVAIETEMQMFLDSV